MNYEIVIGLEVHAQLATQTKLFCGCSNQFGYAANEQTCPVCLAMPGALPVVNERAVELALRAASALECDIHPRSQWSRKNYFYADLPKGYQISQFDRPYATGGQVPVTLDGKTHHVPLTRIHMEEDAGKSVHDEALAGSRSYVDFNRGGTPLIEIVSEPAVRSSTEAAEYMRSMREILRYVGACDGNMEQGNLRCDANVSLRPRGQEKLGTRTELKNINSFRFVKMAVDYEVMRQAEILDQGGEIVQETRLWDVDKGVTRSMRSKEEAHDYRYFPDPDLPELIVSEETIKNIQMTLPELPLAKRERYISQLGLSADAAQTLTEDIHCVCYFEQAIEHHDNAKGIANWLLNDILGHSDTNSLADIELTPNNLAQLVELIDSDVISGKIAKSILPELLKTKISPKQLVEDKGLKQVTDTSAIEKIVGDVIAQNPDPVEQFKAGKTNVIGFLVGQVMKRSQGKANPKVVNEMLRKKLT